MPGLTDTFTILNLLLAVGALGLALQAFIGLSFFISSIWEKESRATFFAALQAGGMFGLLIVYLILMKVGFFGTRPGVGILIAGYLIAILAAILTLRRTGRNPRALEGTKGLFTGEVGRYDERDHVFARNRALRPDSAEYGAYYGEHPEKEAFDAQRRKKGGPMGHPGAIDNPHAGPNVAATLAGANLPLFLSTPEKVNPEQHFGMDGKKIDLSAEEATERVKGFIRHLGADLVGVTEINPLWIYSRRGEIFNENWEDWGGEIHLDHKYAVVFAEEMSFDMVGPAPHTPSVIESSANYAKGAYLSTMLASFIANLGYAATANHLRHYDAILPPLAVDAGLGEVGRLGYLMTKEFGPRVRLSAVTTDLPLVPDSPVDIGAEDFCVYCKKCATTCPSNAIPLEDLEESDGTLRWKLNAETCFDYWGKVGTDCCICMKVCPWSHARTFPHRLVVWFITRNKLARRIFSLMDDIFYGRKPKPKDGPAWARFKPLK